MSSIALSSGAEGRSRTDTSVRTTVFETVEVTVTSDSDPDGFTLTLSNYQGEPKGRDVEAGHQT